MARTYRSKGLTRLVNATYRRLIDRDRGDPRQHLPTTVGRKSGLERTVPLTVVEVAGQRWLVSPYGWVGRALNLHSAGSGFLTRGGVAEHFEARLIDPTEAAPVLRHYLEAIPMIRPYFDVSLDSPMSEIVAEAPRHPVFRVDAIRRE